MSDGPNFSPRSTGIVHPRLRFEPFNLMVSASHWMLFVARELRRGETRRGEARRGEARIKPLSLVDDHVAGEHFTQLRGQRRQREWLLQQDRSGLENALMHDRLVRIT